ncbi:MAG: hypothetical protein ACI8ZX_001876 [Planctomycetota bacterium]|jgi:hypothetical protein
MFNKNLKILIFVLLPLVSMAQKHEFGAMAGVANYFGDLNYNASFASVRPMGAVFYRINFDSRWAFKSSFSYAQLAFDDKLSKNAFNRQRNLHFRTNVMELAAMLELNFLEFNKLKQDRRFSPYFTLGVAVFYFDPQAQLNDQWYYLQSLGTEGQNDPSYSGIEKYSLISFAIPIGGGLKYSINKNWTIGLFGELRVTFTDYIDDVGGVYASPLSLPEGSKGLAYQLADRSGEVGPPIGTPGNQRASSGKADFYMYAGVSVSYTLFRLKCPKF